MKKVLNVLFSTTRQWNPGDEFILIGVINIIKNAFGVEINPIIFNRNPQIRPTHGKNRLRLNTVVKFLTGKSIFPKFLDNSVTENMDLSCIDLAVFAGSPEWYGERTAEFYNICLNNNIPTLYVGVGLGEKLNKLYPYECELLSKAQLITARDENTTEYLSKFGAKFISCPALLSSSTSREVREVKRIGLIYATSKVAECNNIDAKTYSYLYEIYNQLIAKYKGIYDFEFVAHYITEIPYFYKEFPGEVIRYSYDAKDYFEIYNKYDLVVGTRVHGVGVAASMGIPGVMVAHDVRSKTVGGFLGELIYINEHIDDALNKIKNRIENINQLSKNIIEHKEAVMDDYMNTLASCNLKL